jgi:thymidylate kinase
MTTSKRLTIFEGPDGSGKSTAAKRYAELVGARFVHLGPLPMVTDGLARMYAEQMLPAVLGHQEVVMDRCWLSEKPYGDAFRGGANRLDTADVRMLERLALRCQPVVVRCNPGIDSIKASFEARKGEEYLKNVDQLLQVAAAYDSMTTAIPMAEYDYTTNDAWHGLMRDVESLRELTLPHKTTMWSAGNLKAKILLVGDSFAEPKNQDPCFQWPFASFSSQGCSRWFTRQLIEAGIDEMRLCWVNADQFTHPGHDYWIYANADKIFALGGKAQDKLIELGLAFEPATHPQAWKRFHAGEEYPLIKQLKELCRD